MMLKTKAPAVKIGDRAKWGDIIGTVEGFPTHSLIPNQNTFVHVDENGKPIGGVNAGETRELDPRYFYVQMKCECGRVVVGAPSDGDFEVLKA